MRYFPIFVDLADKRVVVVGGGEEGLRKVRLLLKTTAKIQVIAPALHDELAAESRVEWLAKTYDAALLDGATLIYSAEAELNGQVSADAKARSIPVNAVDQAEISTFIIPSIVDRDPVVVAIGTEGAAPVLAMGLRQKIDAMLPQSLGALAARAQSLRAKVADTLPAENRRRSFWQSFFFGAPRDAFFEGDTVAFELSLHDALHGAATNPVGRVTFIGTGADAELLTLKAQRKLQEADVIVHDRTVVPAILEMARRDAVRISVTGDEKHIEGLLAEQARKGLNVMRLQHGAVSSLSLSDRSIAVDVVPSVSPLAPVTSADIVPFPSRSDIQDAALRAVS